MTDPVDSLKKSTASLIETGTRVFGDSFLRDLNHRLARSQVERGVLHSEIDPDFTEFPISLCRGRLRYVAPKRLPYGASPEDLPVPDDFPTIETREASCEYIAGHAQDIPYRFYVGHERRDAHVR